MILTALTEQEKTVIAGGVLGGIFATIMIAALVWYILTVIATWKMLTKAGEAGWKSLIPIYNVYMLYKISSVNFWVWAFIPLVLYVVLQAMVGPNNDNVSTSAAILAFVLLIYSIVGACKFSKGLANAFGKGTGFAVGLFFFPNIFQLILGFGNAKYVGDKK